MSELKIIQLAAYRGNIGDNANVAGTRGLLAQNLKSPIVYTNLEYLDFTPGWGNRRFDEEFARQINQHDLCLIGGGGFFTLGREDSVSATPINIPFEILEKIRIPLVFYAQGISTTYGVKDSWKQKFKTYMDFLLSRSNILVSLRNDGSKKRLAGLLGAEYVDRVSYCPDGGFFINPQPSKHIELPDDKKIIAIQLGGDGIKRRFPANTALAYKQFLDVLASQIRNLLNRSPLYKVVLIPHIPEDLKFIDDFLTALGAPYIRKDVTVAPYIHGQESQDYIFDIYRKSYIVLGMRFHANVCSFGLNVPAVGLDTAYRQITDLYEELGLPERVVQVNHEGFETCLENAVQSLLGCREQIIESNRQINLQLRQKATSFHHKMQDFLSRYKTLSKGNLLTMKMETQKNTNSKKILFNTQFDWRYVAADYTLAMGLQQRGCEVLMLACGGGLPHYCEQQTNKRPRPDCNICLQKIDAKFKQYQLPYITVKEYLRNEDYALADKLAKEYSVADLLRCELYGVPVGKLARLNLFQYYHGFPFSITGEKEPTFRKTFHSAVLLTLAKKRIFDSYQPDIVVSVNGKFLQWAPLVHFAKAKGSQFVTWEDLDQAPSGIALARNGVAHEQRIDEIWAEESQKELTEQQRNELKKHFQLWADGKVSIFRYYDDNTEFNPENIRKRLNLKSGWPIISLFSNVSWDSSSVDFESAFDSMYDWIFSCVEYAIAHPEINLIVRSHPAEVKVPETHKNEVLTCKAIIDKYGNLPDNIKLIDPDSNISSYTVANMSDICMVYTSTMGIELALQGKKVWVAANAYYSNKGFTLDLKSRKHLYELLDSRQFDNTLTSSQIKLAEKFAHIVRLRRVFSVPYLDVSKSQFHFPGRQAYAPGGNPVVDKMCSYVLTGRPFLDIGRDEPADSACDNTAVKTPAEYVYQNLKIRYDSLPSLQTEIKNIFEQKIYDFKSSKPSPLIIDGGAHLGLFSLYAKQKYPQARIIAFEPEQRTYELLKANLAQNRCDQVYTVQSGLYNQNTVLRFASNGADGGAIKSDGTQEIQVVKLSDYIREEVDYLKLNIEGAELEVLEEIEPKLGFVNELCLEYHGFPEIGQRLHRILNILDRNGFRYLIHDFDSQTNPHTKPPFSVSPKTRFYLLVYAKRCLAKTELATAQQKPVQALNSPVVQGEELVRTEPVSRKFGLDRGTSICRYYIEKYLTENRRFITGRVLEIGGRRYTKQYGTQVTQSDVLHAVPSPEATIVGDLQTGENIPDNTYDCIILTQVLECIYDVRSGVKHAVRALKPGGALLITDNGIGPISRYDMDRWGDFWRFTDKSIKAMLAECLPQENITIRTYGNMAAAKAYLDGRCAEELNPAVLDITDRDYQSVITAVAVKPVTVAKDNSSSPAIAQPVLQQPVVLLYHRVAEESLDAQYLAVSAKHFEEHLRELKTHYRVVSLRQLLVEFQQNKNIPNTVALTFDDGYLDNLTQALPLLEKYGIHATIFITADNVEQSRGFWGDKIEYLFLGNRSLPEVLELSEDGTDYRWPLGKAQERLKAHDQIRALLKKKSNQEIEPFVNELLLWAGIRENLDAFRPVLNIEQLRRLAQSSCIEIGSHTLTHSRLRVLSPEKQLYEMIESRRKLESWLGRPVTILSYPYGTKADITVLTCDLARQAGYQYAIANIQGSVLPGTKLFEVPRRLVRNWPGAIFAEWMRSEHKEILEKQTLDQRVETIVQIVSTELRNVQRVGCSVVEQGILK